MGVNYSGVGGVGVLITEQMLDFIYQNSGRTRDKGIWDYYEVLDWFLKGSSITYTSAGDFNYTGDWDDLRLYLCIEGETLDEVYDSSIPFLNTLREKGLNVERSDIKIIEDLCVG